MAFADDMCNIKIYNFLTTYAIFKNLMVVFRLLYIYEQKTIIESNCVTVTNENLSCKLLIVNF